MKNLINSIKQDDIYHILTTQTEIITALHNFFTSKKSLYLLPVMLSPETDKLQNDVHDCNIEYYGQKLHLMKSMILQKQAILLNENIDSIYTISPCIRLEDKAKAKKGRHAIEFQQIDFEFKGRDSEFIINFVEELIIYVFSQVKKNAKDSLAYFNRKINIPSAPFKRYDNEKCIKDMGIDYEKILSGQNNDLFWVLNFDRWVYDKEIISNGKSCNINYDLILPEGFFEIGSGGEREIDRSIIIEKMIRKGIDPNNHEVYLDILNYHLVPSAGMGLGIQRLLQFFTGKHNIDHVYPFPRSIESPIYI